MSSIKNFSCVENFNCYNIGMDEENKRLKEILKNCNTYNCMEEKSTNESKKDTDNINNSSIVGVDNFTAKGIKVLGVDNFTAKGIKVI